VSLALLAGAERCGEEAHALVLGSAVNQGGRSSGLTAPNGPAQTALVAEALRSASVGAADVAAVSLHGTGTPLGDPIEVGALAAAVKAESGRARRVVALGSSKARTAVLTTRPARLLAALPPT
jgi:acyl transferase domain-containing protein